MHVNIDLHQAAIALHTCANRYPFIHLGGERQTCANRYPFIHLSGERQSRLSILPRTTNTAARPGLEPATLWSRAQRLTTLATALWYISNHYINYVHPLVEHSNPDESDMKVCRLVLATGQDSSFDSYAARVYNPWVFVESVYYTPLRCLWWASSSQTTLRYSPTVQCCQ